MRTHIVCIAPEDDEHGAFLAAICHRQAVRFSFLDVRKASGTAALTVDLRRSHFQLGGLTLHDNMALWWRRPGSPRVDERILDSRLRTFASKQWELAVRSALALSGCTVVNDPLAERAAESKLIQSEAAMSVGFHVPETIVTNQPDRAQEFISSLRATGRRCVFKPLFPGRFHFGETRVISDLAGLEEELRLAPVIFQECIERGEDLRVTVFGGRIFCTRVSTDHDIVDWRIDPGHTYWPVPAQTVLADRCDAVLEKLSLKTGSFDFRRDRSGELFFLEVNPSGQFLFMSRFGHPSIGSDFVDFLLERN